MFNSRPNSFSTDWLIDWLIDWLSTFAPVGSPNATFIRVGSSDLGAPANASQVLAVDLIRINEGYLNVDTSSAFNIGVIKLQRPIDCSDGSVCVACLPNANSSSSATAANQTSSCSATSWNVRTTSSGATANGTGKSRQIQQRSAAVMDQMTCEMAIRKDGAIQSDYRLADSRFCLQEAANGSGCVVSEQRQKKHTNQSINQSIK